MVYVYYILWSGAHTLLFTCVICYFPPCRDILHALTESLYPQSQFDLNLWFIVFPKIGIWGAVIINCSRPAPTVHLPLYLLLYILIGCSSKSHNIIHMDNDWAKSIPSRTEIYTWGGGRSTLMGPSPLHQWLDSPSPCMSKINCSLLLVYFQENCIDKDPVTSFIFCRINL